MIELGKLQTLKVLRKTKIGVYLNTASRIQEGMQEDILLPNNQVPTEIQIGEEIEVFVYKDSEDRIIATRKKPHITIGEVALLTVVETTSIGAFLDWGLEKDLFLPFKEQIGRVKKGEKTLIGLYVDKSNRLCATMQIASLLIREAPFKENATVNGVIYNIVEEIGAFVAIQNKYDGLIPNKELYGSFKCGDEVMVRVKKPRLNGVLELSLRKGTIPQIDEDAKCIIEKLQAGNGLLPLNDDSDPTEIKKALNMSKSAFKRAVGRLFKEKKLIITKNGIELL